MRRSAARASASVAWSRAGLQLSTACGLSMTWTRPSFCRGGAPRSAAPAAAAPCPSPRPSASRGCDPGSGRSGRSGGQRDRPGDAADGLDQRSSSSGGLPSHQIGPEPPASTTVVAPQRSICTREKLRAQPLLFRRQTRFERHGSAPGELGAWRESIVARDVDHGGHELDADVAVQVDEPGADEPAGPVDHAIGMSIEAMAGVQDAIAAHGDLAARDDLVAAPIPDHGPTAAEEGCRTGVSWLPSVMRWRCFLGRLAITRGVALVRGQLQPRAWANGAIPGRRAVTGRRVAATDRPKSLQGCPAIHCCRLSTGMTSDAITCVCDVSRWGGLGHTNPVATRFVPP